MSSKPETNTVNGIQTFLKDRYANVLKLHGSSMQRRGEPDLIGGIPMVAMPNDGGRYYTINIPFAFEVKYGANVASTLQNHRLEKWAEVGFCTGVVYSVNEVALLLFAFAQLQAPAADLMFRLKEVNQ